MAKRKQTGVKPAAVAEAEPEEISNSWLTVQQMARVLNLSDRGTVAWIRKNAPKHAIFGGGKGQRLYVHAPEALKAWGGGRSFE